MEKNPSSSVKPRVFIGSSSEGLEVAQYLQASLEERRTLEALVWNQGFFSPTLGHLENLEKGAKDFDFAIVVLTPDVILSARGDNEAAARSNVLFEAGFFVGKLGRERTIIVMREEEVTLPSYLHGVTVQQYYKRSDNILAAALNSVVVKITEHVAKLGPRPRAQQDSAGIKPAALRVFPRSDDGTFSHHIEKQFESCKNVTLIGTGLNILSRDPVRSALMARAAAGECRLEILLANPFSPEVQTRLIEEELGTVRPQVAKPGLLKRLDTILDEWGKLGWAENIDVRLFGNYPTFALLIVDSDFYVYPYGYARLGNYSPVFHFSELDEVDRHAVDFFKAHHADIRRDSLSARQVMKLRSDGIADVTQMRSASVYLVPPEDSELHQFGSKVLGYDVRARKALKSRWARYVGSARDFGFHLTCADALFYFTEHELRVAEEELQFMAREFQPFELQDFEVVGGFPDPSSISLVPQDKSGTLEAIHFEMVHRLYRRAAASNYSLGRTKPVRDKELQRARLMIAHYRAPYILQRFRPHFTLLTSVPPAEMERVEAELKSAFAKEVSEASLRVEKLAFMGQSSNDAPWVIRREINLG